MRQLNFALAIALLGLLSMTSCRSNREIRQLEEQTIFSLMDSATILLDGVINTKALDDFNSVYDKSNTITKVYIKNCDGSINDEVNLVLAKRVHDLGLNTHILEGGFVASGGTDFFLAGVTRSIASNVKIGVHSWSDGRRTAIDYPNDHSVHQPYISYYTAIGFSEQEASDFYFFTINAASSEDIHWMTKDEIEKYKMLK